MIATDPNAVAPQLERVLSSPLFAQSKRCHAFLRHVVEAYLAGAPERLKERCIGFEVFHREADYDTTRDSIVRTTAAEVRKRLAQYYLEPEHEGELRIALPNGSYCPEFRPAPPASAPLAPSSAAANPVALASVAPATTASRRISIAAASTAAAAALAIVVYWLWPATNLDSFWRPVLNDRSPAVVCIEQPLRIYRFTGPRRDELNQKMVGDANRPAEPRDSLEHSPIALSELEPIGPSYFTYGDLVATSRLSELLSKKGKPFQILGDRSTAYRDLRGRPVILLGQFNNQWTLDLMTGLPFYLDKNTATRIYEVRDRTNGNKVIASIGMSDRREDYAVISRIFDAATETTVVSVIGTTFFGTLAGADFLTRGAYMDEAFGHAPTGWSRKNIQVVIHAFVLNDTPGPPTVVATRYW